MLLVLGNNKNNWVFFAFSIRLKGIRELRGKKIYTATFAGFTPAFQPKILAVVVLHGLEGEDHSGGLDAAPVFSKVVTQALNVLEMGS